MQTLTTDVAIIGAGTAGLAAWRSARKHTDEVLIIEGGAYGTTCARVGCMPSKLLIAAAEAAHTLDVAPTFGIHPQGYRVDGRAVMDRVRRERDRFVGFVLESVDNIPAERRIRGYARFIDDHTLIVGDHTRIEAKAIVIASGSSPFIPEVLQAAGDRMIVNDHVFDWEDLPESVAVFGPGVIGLELGQALHRLGVRVRVFGRSGAIGPLTDPEIKAYSTQALAAEYPLDTDALLTHMERVEAGVDLRWQDSQGQAHADTFAWVLVATGRKPNLDRLGLENTSLILNPDGTTPFDLDTLQCGNSSIFLAGDANHYLPVLHEAADEGVTAGTNAALYPHIQPGLRRAPMSVIFSDPQIALAGKRWQDLVPGSFVTGRVSFENQGRSRVMLKNKGILHVYADKASGRFLGVEMMGPSTEHLAHLLAWAYQQEMTIAQMLEMPFYHPVIEEGLRTALRDAAAQLG
jgi:dihydrolipoamide dehydrogenase